MRILCLNVGSSSLKASVIETTHEATNEATLESTSLPAPTVLGHAATQFGKVDAVAHRLVHGGERFRAPAIIDAPLVAAVKALTAIDPTHTPKALEGIAAAQAAFPGVPHVACFDTAFHSSLPPEAFTYAIPRAWTEGFGLRRFGFHGLSVAYAVRRTEALLQSLPERLLVCHLGSGSSLTAVRAGRSIDTTMGFTPLEGVPMSTRAGSVDPGLLLYLMREQKLSVAEIDAGLEKDGGLRALFGGDGDLREVLSAKARGDARAALAYGTYLTGLRRGLGAMLASLGGLDALVFTGGIGEHASEVRTDLVTAIAFAGAAIDPRRNQSPEGDAFLSPDGAKPAILRIIAREDLTMAREAAALLG